MERSDRNQDEHQLVEDAQRDARAFAALYAHTFERVYAYVLRRSRSREEAEDLTADVYQRALAKLGSFEWRGTPFIAWLYRIAANLLADRARHDAPVGRDAGEAPSEAVDERAAAEIERRALVFELVAKLPADQRRVIELRFGEEKSLREAARALQRSEGAIKQLQLRALQNLRGLLEGENG